MRVKVCGIDSEDALNTAVLGGVDAVGFLVGVTHKAEDKLAPELARELIRVTPPFVSTVGVTHLRNANQIIDLANYIRCSIVQLQAEVTEAAIVQVREALPGTKLLKAVHVIDQSAVEYALRMAPYVDGIILDSRTEDRLGGTGKVHDWTISRMIVQRVPVPVVLAGGLNADNVAEAIRRVRPYGVDVNSGVEIAGKKDLTKVSLFVSAARAAQRGAE